MSERLQYHIRVVANLTTDIVQLGYDHWGPNFDEDDTYDHPTKVTLFMDSAEAVEYITNYFVAHHVQYIQKVVPNVYSKILSKNGLSHSLTFTREYSLTFTIKINLNVPENEDDWIDIQEQLFDDVANQLSNILHSVTLYDKFDEQLRMGHNIDVDVLVDKSKFLFRRS